MKRLVLLVGVVLLLSGTNVLAFRLNWQPVTKYSDGTAIESSHTVKYDAWVDDQVLVTGTELISAPLSDNTFGAVHTYTVRTRLEDGRVSDNVVATLSNPLDDRAPAGPGAPLSISE